VITFLSLYATKVILHSKHKMFDILINSIDKRIYHVSLYI
jgi:hypothetical protein